MKARRSKNKLTLGFNLALVFLLAAGLFSGLQTTRAASPAQETQPQANVIYRGVSTAVKFDISPPLREIAPRQPNGETPQAPRDLPTGLEGALGPQDVDPLVQGSVGAGEIPLPIVSFNGPPNISGVSPPDPVGDVGPNHYVAMSNLSFQIFDKAGNSVYGPALNNTLWAGFGGDCQTDNAGDPIVVYDQLADRWMLTQFTSSGPTYFNCVALSTTGDPTGSYYRWAFSTGSNFPDYPKYGVWPDAYYNSSREFAGGSTFAGIGAYAYNRDQMLVGNPAPQVISFLATPGATPYNVGDGLLPTDLDGSTLPPAGSPNYFVGSMDNGGPYGAPQDALTIWKFHVDFTTPALSTFTLANTLPIAPYDTIPAFCSGRSCIPQPGTTNKVDSLAYRQRPMWRLAYRNFGAHEALVTNQSVEASSTMSGIRWWEIRDPNGTPVVYQEGTYAPGLSDGVHRWMGSIAMDSAGNMALGYSASNATSTFPSSWYTGRLFNDPLGTLPQGEASIINGTGSQTGSQRWGDYTSMNIDPVDDCTFWYVNEWIPVTSSVGWQLRIGSFKFPTCGGFSVNPSSLDIFLLQGQTGNLDLNLFNGSLDTVDFTIQETPSAAWLSEIPASGSVPVGGTEVVDVAFDASVVGAGVYNTVLDVLNNSPAGTLSVPVQMTVVQMGVEMSPPQAKNGDPGTTLTYNLTVSNTSTIAESFDVAVTGNAWATTLPATLGPLAPGFSTSLLVDVVIPAGATPGDSDIATVSVTSQLDPAASQSRTLTSTANTVYGADLTPPTDAATANPGEMVTYTLSLTNTGNTSDSFDLILSGNTWATSSPTSLGPLAPGASDSLQVVVEVPASVLGGEVDTVTVTAASQGDPTATDSSVLDTTASTLYGVQAAPPSQAKTGALGSTITYTIDLTNTGNLTDTIDVAVSGNAWTTTAPAQVLLGPGGSDVVSVAVEIPALAINGSNDSTTLTFTSQGDPSLKAQVDLLTTAVIPAEVELEKTVSAVSAVVGSQLEYTLTVLNSSASVNATDVVLTDTLPAGVTLVSTNNSSCNLVANQVVCDLGVLLAGHSALVQITVTADAPGSVVNQAQVSAFNDITPENNNASATTEVISQLKLYLPLVVKQFGETR
jgi:uncharacterized repeat protein (TIGR01451 family)